MNPTDPDPTLRGAAMVPDADLHDLFSRRRPDAARFAAGVAQRLAARPHDGAMPSVPAAPTAPTARWRRAASVLPFDPLVGAGTVLGSLALPTVLVITGVATVVDAIYRLGERLRGQPMVRDDAAPTWRQALGMLAAFAAVGAAAAAAWWSSLPVGDVLLTALLVSMLALMLVLARAARDGVADRESTATLADHLLSFLLVVAVPVALASDLVDSPARWNAATVPLVLAGLVFVAAYRAPIARVLSLGFVAAMAVWLGGELLRLPGREPEPALLQSQVADAAPPVEALIDWHGLGVAGATLRELGVPTRLHGDLPQRFAAALASEARVHPKVVTAAAHLGLLTPQQWSSVAETTGRFVQSTWLTSDRPLRRPSYDEYELPLLLATDALDDAARERVTQRVAASWPGPDAKQPLATAYLCLRWLELLGRTDLAEPQRDAVHRLLVEHQVPAGVSGAGAFREFLGIPAADPEATHHAVTLLRHFGAPAGLDLAALHDRLERMLRHLTRIGRGASGHALMHCADLLALRHDLPAPAPAPLHWLVRERLLVAFVLVVGLCAYVVHRAPPRRPRDILGAAP